MEYRKKAEHFRDLAIKARAEAAHAPDPQIRGQLIALSEAYDEMCLQWIELAGRFDDPGQARR